MKLNKARVNYTHYINYNELPEEVRDILYEAAVQEDLGTMYDYTDGDFKVTPTWYDTDVFTLPDAVLNAVLVGEPAENQSDEEFDALYERMEELFGGIKQVDIACAVEIARRAILKALPQAERYLIDNSMAIFFFQ